MPAKPLVIVLVAFIAVTVLEFSWLNGLPDIYRLDADELFNKAVSRLKNVYFPTVRQDSAADAHGVPIVEIQEALGAFATKRANRNATLNIGLPKALAPENWRLGTIDFLADADGTGRRYSLRSLRLCGEKV